MKRLLKLFLNYQLKTLRSNGKTGGFTLIELLVGLILAFLIITPLLGFVVNMMDTDRKEQAKATSEQEIQAALNYISRDLDQAVFIYDAYGLQKIQTQVPQVTDGVPVLVFWKRQIIPNIFPTSGLARISDCENNQANQDKCDDAFTYSLVAYYLIKSQNCAQSPWSCTARIGRIQLDNELKNPKDQNDTKPGSPGFQLFPSSSSSLEQRMNAWTRASGDIDRNPVQILIDYVDQTQEQIDLAFACPTTARPLPRPDLPKNATDTQAESTPYLYRQVPSYKGTGAVPAQFQTGSFYACVDAEQTLAKVYIRGNALARNRPKTQPSQYDPNNTAYFPRASIQAQGHGLIGQ
ncbi:MAG TPA: hormogonium polysaccharide secretion pseudopilin HpsC [Allocoleopsis sp.]